MCREARHQMPEQRALVLEQICSRHREAELGRQDKLASKSLTFSRLAVTSGAQSSLTNGCDRVQRSACACRLSKRSYDPTRGVKNDPWHLPLSFGSLSSGTHFELNSNGQPNFFTVFVTARRNEVMLRRSGSNDEAGSG
jgi:hypothetical protein